MRGRSLLLLLAACGSPTVVPPPSPGADGVGGAGAVVATPDAAPVAPEATVAPGSPEDVLGRLFDGAEPAIPRGFGGVRPGMTRDEARRALPASWGGAWEAPHPDERGVTLAVDVGDTGFVESLIVRFDQQGASARLEQAWGPPDLRARTGGAVCWLATATRLKGCYLNVDGRMVEIGAYVPLEDALGKGGRRAPSALLRFLGAPARDVEAAFPEAVEVTVKDEPDKHHLAVRAPSTEYAADARYDRFAFFLDRDGRVREVEVRWGAQDPTSRPALVGRLREATRDLAASVTVVEAEPVDVVLLLDREEGLR